MPYRRLPNTDNARVRALKLAIEKKRFLQGGNIFTEELHNLERVLHRFEFTQQYYLQSLDKQAESNRKFQELIREARLYVSHFIQVLNMCIMRNEFKDSIKQFYKLPSDNLAVPDLTSNDDLLEVGNNTIEGERLRLQEGGVPIYNPTIARVNVAHSKFKDAYTTQKRLQQVTTRYLDELAAQRGSVDEVIRNLWNQIEDHFKNAPETERLERCREFGVVYYYRKGEKKS